MDRIELHASETENKRTCASSPGKQSCLGMENTGKAEKLIKESKTDKQGKSESSSSNTPHVALPASSNENCQETSLETQSCKLGSVCATDSSTCTDGYKPETTVLPANGGNPVKLFEAIDSIRTRNSDNDLSGMRSSDNLSGMSSDNNYVTVEHIDVSKTNRIKNEAKKFTVHGKAEQIHEVVDAAPVAAKDTDRDFEASGSSSSGDARISEKFPGSYVDSVGPHGRSCLTETVSEAKVSFPDPFMKMASEVSDSIHSWELPSQNGGLSNIDLNEEVIDHNSEYGSAKETIQIDLIGSVSKPKPVNANPGSLVFFLQLGTKNEGKLGGWKGSARTSAFQPIFTKKISLESKEASPINGVKISETIPAMKGFDLNLDAPGADSDVDPAEPSFPSKKLDFDLNCASGNDENLHRSVRDFDLNDDPECVPGQASEAPRKGGLDISFVSVPEGSKRHDYRSFRPAFSADMPRFFPGQAQPFLVGTSNMIPSSEHLQRVSFLQPQLAYTPVHHTLRVDPKDRLYPTGMVPYTVDPHAMGAGSVPTFPGHVFQVPQGSRPNYGASASNPIMEEQMKGFQFAGVSGTKRREPEGGWDSPQLCFRQMASSWH